MRYVYGLIDPRNGHMKYVGMTKNLSIRMMIHVRDAVNAKTPSPKDEWVRSLRNEGLQFDLVVLEESPDESAREDEKFWIQYWKFLGAELFNIYQTKLRKMRARSKRVVEFSPVGEIPECGLFSIREAAKYVSRSHTAICNAINTGHIDFVMVAGRRMVTPESLNAYYAVAKQGRPFAHELAKPGRPFGKEQGT